MAWFRWTAGGFYLALSDDGTVRALPDTKRPGQVPDSLGKAIQIKLNTAVSAA